MSLTYQIKRTAASDFDDIGEAGQSDGQVLLLLDILHRHRGCSKEEGEGKGRCQCQVGVGPVGIVEVEVAM